MPAYAQLEPQNKINFDIEALRGFAAIFVVWHHITVFGYLLDPTYTLDYPLFYGPSGHFCVLIFFVLSGYVIGLSTKKPLTWATSGEYLKKRLVRLYPIFLITLAFTLLVTPRVFSADAILGNLALLQGGVVANINPPGWSLNFEMLYYVFFIVVSMFQLKPLWVIAGALALGLANYALYGTLHTPIISSYCYGLVFWIIGLLVSQLLAKAAPDKASYQVLLSCLLFILCSEQYNVLGTLMRMYVHISFPAYISWDQQAVEIYDLSALPLALLIVLVFIGKHIPYRLLLLKGLFLFSALPKLSFVVLHAYRGDLDWLLYVLPTLFLAASLLCLFVPSVWLERVGKAIVQGGISLGALSYAVYLVHFPLIVLFSRIHTFSGTATTFTVRIILLFGLTIGISYWLEKVMQPRIKAFFFPTLARPSLSAKQNIG
jgi:peptidoglycan/LPS O-acetylase OafA/YrhL